MRWHDHTELPAGKDLALIVVSSRIAGGDPFFLPELYYYDADDEHWYGCANLLLIKHAEFRWLPAFDLLQSIP